MQAQVHPRRQVVERLEVIHQEKAEVRRAALLEVHGVANFPKCWAGNVIVYAAVEKVSDRIQDVLDRAHRKRERSGTELADASERADRTRKRPKEINQNQAAGGKGKTGGKSNQTKPIVKSRNEPPRRLREKCEKLVLAELSALTVYTGTDTNFGSRKRTIFDSLFYKFDNFPFPFPPLTPFFFRRARDQIGKMFKLKPSKRSEEKLRNMKFVAFALCLTAASSFTFTSLRSPPS